MTTRIIEVWICPRDDCNNYYSAESAGDRSSITNHDIKWQPTFTRDHCPNCRMNGLLVKRVRRFAVILDVGPEDLQVVNEQELIRKAYLQLKGEQHESVR